MRRAKQQATASKQSAKPGVFQRGHDSRRTAWSTRLGELPPELASALDERFPGASTDIKRTLRDAIRQGRGLSAVGKHGARMASLWSTVALHELAMGNVEGAMKASREAESNFRRLMAEIDRSLAAHARRERPASEGEGKTDGGTTLDDGASSAEVAALLDRFGQPPTRPDDGVSVSKGTEGGSTNEPRSESNLPLQEGPSE